VYRGHALRGLQGTYFFADFCLEKIWSFRYDGISVSQLTDRTAELAPFDGSSIDLPTAIGEDAAGELYIVDIGGEIFKIVPQAPALGRPQQVALAVLLAAAAGLAARRFRTPARA
jgi:hypothetical protein